MKEQFHFPKPFVICTGTAMKSISSSSGRLMFLQSKNQNTPVTRELKMSSKNFNCFEDKVVNSNLNFVTISYYCNLNFVGGLHSTEIAFALFTQCQDFFISTA